MVRGVWSRGRSATVGCHCKSLLGESDYPMVALAAAVVDGVPAVRLRLSIMGLLRLRWSSLGFTG